MCMHYHDTTYAFSLGRFNLMFKSFTIMSSPILCRLSAILRLTIPIRLTSPLRVSSLPFRAIHTTRTSRSDNDRSSHYASEMGSLDVLGDVPVPKSSVTICTPRGFKLHSGEIVENGDAVMMVNDEVFHWRPWEHERFKGEKRIFNGKGQLDLPKEVFRVFEKMEEKPDMIIIGSGPSIAPMTKEMRQIFVDLKIRFDVLDTRNAAAQYNLLATERGPETIAAALFPMGWKDGVGVSDV